MFTVKCELQVNVHIPPAEFEIRPCSINNGDKGCVLIPGPWVNHDKHSNK
jgi:hypothetical protein